MRRTLPFVAQCSFILSLICFATSAKPFPSAEPPASQRLFGGDSSSTLSHSPVHDRGESSRGGFPPHDAIKAVKGLIERVLGDHMVDAFVLHFIPSALANASDVFEISWDDAMDKPIIRGNNGVSISSGLYWYMKYWCNCSFTWGLDGSGSQLSGCTNSHELPRVDVDLRMESPVRWRYYYNVCTLGYSTAFWQWERWEKEIDWMALHGINLPLSFTGQEYAWIKLYQEYGLTEEEIDNHFAGAAFLPWGRMGNIRRWGGPLSRDWIDQQFALQKSILQRQQEFGMMPVLPGFGGHIPEALARKFPNASVIRSRAWGHFNSTYTGDYLLQPSDPLFPQIGKRFVELQKTLYSVHTHVYNADTFNEMKPASNDSAYLASVGFNTYQGIAQADPEGVWMLQGWLFNDRSWWKNEDIRAYLSKVPKDRAIVLDLYADVSPVWSRTDSFFGTPFVWCLLHNFGGKRGVYGNLSDVSINPVVARTSPGSTMLGTGIVPEAIEQNPALYELMTEMGWRSIALGDTNSSSTTTTTTDAHHHPKIPHRLGQWVDAYIAQRYGGWSEEAHLAWALLLDSAYHTETMLISIVQLLPWFDLPAKHYPEWLKAQYDPSGTHVVNALRHLAKSCAQVPRCESNGPWSYDAVDVSRQVVANLFVDAMSMFSASYDEFIRDGSNTTLALVRIGALLSAMVDDIDALLASDVNYLLGPWLKQAKSWGATEEESQRLEFNARNQITLWGPRGNHNDYASKAWAGLYKDYYSVRWSAFINVTVASVASGTPITPDARAKYSEQALEWGGALDRATQTYPTHPQGNAVDRVKAVVQAYALPRGTYGAYRMHPNHAVSSVAARILPNATWTRDPAQLSLLCNTHPRCVAFTTDGWLYDEKSPTREAPAVDLYVAQS